MSISLDIRRIAELPGDIDALRAEAAGEGFRFVDTLVKDWQSAANRFDAPGELLAGAFQSGGLVAICGLNIDPYAADSLVGRLRHLYVLKKARRQGVASSLVRHLLTVAKASFFQVRLFTDTEPAAAFYRSFGFIPSQSPKASHILQIR